jgi:ariadne-1
MDVDASDNESIAQDSASEFEYEEQSDADLMGGESEDDYDSQDHDDAMVIEPPEVRKSPYLTMNRDDVSARQKRCVMDCENLLDLRPGEAFVLLREHAWDLDRLQEAWFDNEDKVRRRCGLGPRGVPSSSSSAACSTSCPICMQTVNEVVLLDCGHGFCPDCWRQYLNTQVADGKAAIQACCPQHKCRRAVPVEFFEKYCGEEQQKKYTEWYIRSYVDDNPNVKWCPNPSGCIFACEYQGVEPLEIKCTCGFMSCWACGEEAHRPANCKTVTSWNTKNSAESENIGWIRANTKKCPKCHRAIEKNQGCNHMICSKAGGCGHEFCWLCLGEWSTHGTATGGYYQCNIYDKQAKEGKHDEEERSRLKAKHALDKYMFYFERFMDHDRGMKLTVREEQEIEKHVQELHDKHGFEIIELQFLYDALKQVRACRRVLKWTYVYGYYLEEAGPEKNLFEYLQKNLEEKTDNLHELLEKNFKEVFNVDGQDASSGWTESPHAKFMVFRSHVTNFSNVTQKFLQQILNDLGFENSLLEMGSVPSVPTHTLSNGSVDSLSMAVAPATSAATRR